MPDPALPAPLATLASVASAVTRCAVTFGPYADATGRPAFVGRTGRIRPTRQVVTEDGEVIVSDWVDVTLGADSTATVSLAHTDQPGLGSPFRYEIKWEGRIGDPSPGDKSFALPVAAGATADFDKLVDSPDVPDVAVPIAASVSAVEAAAASAGTASTRATEAATSAADAAADASTALTHAINAAADADAVRVDANAAAGSAAAAQSSALLAEQRAQAAETSASNASASATNALSQAQASATSATAAQNAVGRQFTAAGVVVDDLILTRDNGATVNAGNVRGPQGIQGVKGDPGDLTATDQTTAGTTLSASGTGPITRIRTLTANATVNALATPANTVAFTCTTVLIQAASGGPYTVTWPSGIKWAGGAPAPTMPTTASARLVVHLFWTGSEWLGMVGGTFF